MGKVYDFIAERRKRNPHFISFFDDDLLDPDYEVKPPVKRDIDDTPRKRIKLVATVD